MKVWLASLSSREKTLLIIISVVILVLLLFFLLWMPVQHFANNAKQQARDNQILFLWMQQADRQLANTGPSRAPIKTVTPTKRLAVIQQSLATAPFAKTVKKLSQTSDDNVTIVFATSSFDDINAWLINLWEQEGIALHEATFHKTNTPGIVNATLVLGASS